MSNLRQKLWSSAIFRNLIYILIASVVLFVALIFFLRMYTNHGQKLILPDYVGMNVEDARKSAKENEFEIVVDDSVHIVGKPGGEILSQNPAPESGVKEGRKVYVTIAKYNPDIFLSSRLPQLYGERFDLKAKELETLFKIKSNIKAYAYDPGPRDHILEVQYNGKPIENAKGKNNRVEIAKGDQLDFVLSKREGGRVKVPNLVCKELEAAKFMCQAARLGVGEVIEKGEISDLSTAYVYDQIPKANGERVDMGTSIQIFVVQEKPDACK
ncbi:MAG: PASTA domain-containing protein [Saprospiraceae bacterium]|nr:PASTA domain-containing protein [Saprospiraceae bacterium]